MTQPEFPKASSPEHLLTTTLLWFQRARPIESVTSKMGHTQLGVHFEEVAEMVEQLLGLTPETEALLSDVHNNLSALAQHLKEGDDLIDLNDRKLFLDSICDQIVTGIGCAHMLGMDVLNGMREVNRGNWSKFGPDGQPFFDENGKIIKGPNYKKPDLTPFV